MWRKCCPATRPVWFAVCLWSLWHEYVTINGDRTRNAKRIRLVWARKPATDNCRGVPLSRQKLRLLGRTAAAVQVINGRIRIATIFSIRHLRVRSFRPETIPTVLGETAKNQSLHLLLLPVRQCDDCVTGIWPFLRRFLGVDQWRIDFHIDNCSWYKN